MKTDGTGLIILAAGTSQRLGRPKQLLHYKGITLVEHAIQTGLASVASPIIVVLGAYANEIMSKIARYPLYTVANTAWQEGIASSIRIGLKALIAAEPQTSSTVFMVCDQPCVTASLINTLVACGQIACKSIVASTYGETIGVPAWFHKDVFIDLMKLKGDQGARTIIHQRMDDVVKVAFPPGLIDIDTDEDFNALIKNNIIPSNPNLKPAAAYERVPQNIGSL